jgi:hypothetical protein
LIIIWTKTSIRYAKENDREMERERKKGRRRDIKREGMLYPKYVSGSQADSY